MARGHGVVIAGGGLAAQRCTETLRSRGYDGRIRLVCAEPHAPYDRPPLSKDLATGAPEAHEVRFRDAGWYDDNAIELLTGRRAEALDPAARTLHLDDGSELAYEELLIATGAAPRALPMLERFANAHFLRTLADARRLRAELGAGARLVVIGAGFIGQEVAAVARGMGLEVTIVEALELPLAGVLGRDVGRWIVELHREEGVRVLTSARLVDGHGNGRIEELELATGERIGCDAVVVGVGVAPAARWLEGSGLDSSGVRTDPTGRTAIPHVHAAGDVARPYNPVRGDHVRTEHWDAASRQGVAVARAMLGDAPQDPVPPSFWSDQYGLRIQFVGHSAGFDELRFDGRPEERDFSVLYLRGGRPVAALAVNRPRDLARARRLISASEPNPQQKETDDELHPDDR
jgi:NADPH-dependent 2,4-dienoyl-CoA reductase/sulfur reductase-like enzyme